MIRLVRCVATLLVAWVAFEAGRAGPGTLDMALSTMPDTWLPWIAAALAGVLAGIGWLADVAAENESAQADRLRQQRDQRRAERDAWRDAYLLDRGAAAAWREETERYRGMLTQQQAVTRSWRDLAQEQGRLAAGPGFEHPSDPPLATPAREDAGFGTADDDAAVAAASSSPATEDTDPTLVERAAPTLEQPLPVDGRPR